MTTNIGVVENLPYVQATLLYLEPTVERPRYYYHTAEPTPPPYAAHTVHIHDVRSLGSEMTLDRQGYALIERPSAVRDFDDLDQVRGAYYSESARIVAEVTGARRVHVFDHVVRRGIPGMLPSGYTAPPAERVHVDRSSNSIGEGFIWRSMRRTRQQRMRELLGEEADELLRGRLQVITLWRPIREPVQDKPLAVCDFRTIAAEDLVPSDLEYGDRVAEGYSVTYSPRHTWFYAPKMRRDEAWLLKCSDTRGGDCAQFTPHCAFKDPTTSPDAPYRESIEVRMLVFHGPETAVGSTEPPRPMS